MRFKSFKSLLALSLVLGSNAFAATTWYVNGVTGSDTNDCLSATAACKTIGHAITLSASGDAITVAPATYPENLDIGISLKITGSGGRPVIDGGLVNTVVTVSSSTAHVTLSSLQIQNGGASPSLVGGVSNIGTLTLNNSIVTGNYMIAILNRGTMSISGSMITYNTGGPIAFKFGIPSFAIWNSGTLTMSISTVAGNIVRGLNGGIIGNYGTLIVNSSTISGNRFGTVCTLKSCGGGSILSSSHTMTLNNSTVSGNVGWVICERPVCPLHIRGYAVASSGAASINSSTISTNSLGYGLGVINIGTATLQNSIVSKNGSRNCSGSGTVTSKGYNLSSDGTCAFSGPGDMNHTNPMLGALQNNGGPTQTMALPSGSHAIDAGNPAGCTDGLGHLLTTDQRGMPRPDKEDKSGCDMGAYESQSD